MQTPLDAPASFPAGQVRCQCLQCTQTVASPRGRLRPKEEDEKGTLTPPLSPPPPYPPQRTPPKTKKKPFQGAAFHFFGNPRDGAGRSRAVQGTDLGSRGTMGECKMLGGGGGGGTPCSHGREGFQRTFRKMERQPASRQPSGSHGYCDTLRFSFSGMFGVHARLSASGHTQTLGRARRTRRSLRIREKKG